MRASCACAKLSSHTPPIVAVRTYAAATAAVFRSPGHLPICRHVYCFREYPISAGMWSLLYGRSHIPVRSTITYAARRCHIFLCTSFLPDQSLWHAALQVCMQTSIADSCLTIWAMHVAMQNMNSWTGMDRWRNCLMQRSGHPGAGNSSWLL
jgi:hypothetical protein